MEVLVSVSELFGEGRNQAVVDSSTTRPFISCFVRHLSFVLYLNGSFSLIEMKVNCNQQFAEVLCFWLWIPDIRLVTVLLYYRFCFSLYVAS